MTRVTAETVRDGRDGMARALPAVCKGCGRRGVVAGQRKPKWCRCRTTSGPFQAPPRHVTCFVFGSPTEFAAMAADAERARAIRNEYIDARDAGADARWTATGRRRPVKSSTYRAWRARFDAASKALVALQSNCDHPERSIFNRRCCVRCAAVVDPKNATR